MIDSSRTRRGAIGAAGWLIMLLYFALRNPNDILALPYAPLFMFFGAVAGAIIGITIQACRVVGGRDLGVTVRALIGAGLMSVIVGIFYAMEVGRAGRVEPTSRGRLIADALVIIMLSGALPGILARPTASRKCKE